MPTVTINDLILARGPGVTEDTPTGTTFTYDEDPDLSELKDVRDGLVFETPDGSETGVIPVGSTVEIDGVTYTLTAVHEFWGTYTKIDPETGETFTQQGQTVALTLEDGDGNVISFLSPSDTFNVDDPWIPGEILSIEVFSTPVDEGQVNVTPGTEESKLSGDDDVEIPCFVAGTLIDTADGRKPVEALRAGDLVLTRDHGYMPLLWTGQRNLTVADMAAHPDYASVMLRAGSLGLNLPERYTRVSPAHRVLICGPRAELLFGEKEVLVPAHLLAGQPGIERDESPVSYVHIMFASHQIVLGDGMWSESFQPADHSLDGLGKAQRDEILALFPELAGKSGQAAYAAARMTLKAHEARLLFAA